MAIGDKGAAKGLLIFPATQAHGLGYQNDNQRADDIAEEIDARATADADEVSARHIAMAAEVAARNTAIATARASLQSAINSLAATVNGKQANLGFTPVRQITMNGGAIGFRWNNTNVVVNIGGVEFEMSFVREVNGLRERMDRAGIPQ